MSASVVPKDVMNQWNQLAKRSLPLSPRVDANAAHAQKIANTRCRYRIGDDDLVDGNKHFSDPSRPKMANVVLRCRFPVAPVAVRLQAPQRDRQVTPQSFPLQRSTVASSDTATWDGKAQDAPPRRPRNDRREASELLLFELLGKPPPLLSGDLEASLGSDFAIGLALLSRPEQATELSEKKREHNSVGLGGAGSLCGLGWFARIIGYEFRRR